MTQYEIIFCHSSEKFSQTHHSHSILKCRRKWFHNGQPVCQSVSQSGKLASKQAGRQSVIHSVHVCIHSGTIKRIWVFLDYRSVESLKLDDHSQTQNKWQMSWAAKRNGFTSIVVDQYVFSCVTNRIWITIFTMFVESVLLMDVSEWRSVWKRNCLLNGSYSPFSQTILWKINC